MKKPIWLKSYESSLKLRKEQKRNREMLSLFVVPAVFVGIGVVILWLGRTDLMPYLGWAGGILGMSSFIALALSPQGVPEDEAKPVRDTLARLLTTNEEVEEFDRQLCGFPKYGIEVSDEGSVGITDTYLVSRYEFCGRLSYRIAKLSEVADGRVLMHGSDASEAEQKYLIDFLNSDGERLMAVWVDGASKMKQLEEALAKSCPGLKLRDSKAL